MSLSSSLQCSGNFRSTWFAEGGYEPIAEVLLNELDVDFYFLEVSIGYQINVSIEF